MDRNLIDYLPPVPKEVREFQLIMEAEQPEISDLWDTHTDALNDQFIESSTENGVFRREQMLKISPKSTDTLDDRKFRLLTRENEQLPFTMRGLERQLATLCGDDGYNVELQGDIFNLIVKIALTAKSMFNDVVDLLDRIIPANLTIDLDLEYNQHITLSGFTHRQLSAFTHDQLRNEVLAIGNRNAKLRA